MAAPLPVNKQVWGQLSKVKNLSRDNNLSKGKFFYDDDFAYQSNTEKDARAVVAGKLWPTSNIYKDHALRIEIQLSSTYPFEPPEVKIDPPIYHPNVNEIGRLCCDKLATTGTWKTATTLLEVLDIIVDAIDNPCVDSPANADAAKDFTQNKAEYERKAAEKLKNAERRSQ